jgi:uncharacterized protein
VCALRVTVTGATGLIGAALVSSLQQRGAEVTVLVRDPQRARARLAHTGTGGEVQALAWEPLAARRAIRDSRVSGTRNLVEGLAQAQPRPALLVSASAVGYYGPHGEEPLDEETPAGGDFLGQVCADWEAAAASAKQLGVRVVQVRFGVVLDGAGGALAKMLPPFRLGLGGPVAGGRQYMSWIHLHDATGMILAALEDERWQGPVNVTAPEPVTNREFARTLGRALGRPALLPTPGLALRALYGEMADVVIGGARALPAKALVLGYEFAYPQLQPALRAALR